MSEQRDVLERYQYGNGPNCCESCVGMEGGPCEYCTEGLAVSEEMAAEIRRLRAEVGRLREEAAAWQDEDRTVTDIEKVYATRIDCEARGDDPQRTDTERLEWMESHAATVTVDDQDESERFFVYPSATVDEELIPCAWWPSLRLAIDTAMDAEERDGE